MSYNNDDDNNNSSSSIINNKNVIMTMKTLEWRNNQDSVIRYNLSRNTTATE